MKKGSRWRFGNRARNACHGAVGSPCAPGGARAAEGLNLTPIRVLNLGKAGNWNPFSTMSTSTFGSAEVDARSLHKITSLSQRHGSRVAARGAVALLVRGHAPLSYSFMSGIVTLAGKAVRVSGPPRVRSVYSKEQSEAPPVTASKSPSATTTTSRFSRMAWLSFEVSLVLLIVFSIQRQRSQGGCTSAWIVRTFCLDTAVNRFTARHPNPTFCDSHHIGTGALNPVLASH